MMAMVFMALPSAALALLHASSPHQRAARCAVRSPAVRCGDDFYGELQSQLAAVSALDAGEARECHRAAVRAVDELRHAREAIDAAAIEAHRVARDAAKILAEAAPDDARNIGADTPAAAVAVAVAGRGAPSAAQNQNVTLVGEMMRV